MAKTIITIGRECGSGGHEIGKRLSEALNIPFYDKEILARAAKDSGICEAFFHENDEKPTHSFLYSLVMDTYSFNGSTLAGYGGLPLNHRLFLAQFDAIKKIASEGPCVLVGRCADYVLENHSDVLNVFVTGDPEDRIKRIADKYEVSYTEAKNLVTKTDKERSNYYNFFSNKSWGKADQYDICINSSIYGIEGSVEAIKALIALKENL